MERERLSEYVRVLSKRLAAAEEKASEAEFYLRFIRLLRSVDRLFIEEIFAQHSINKLYIITHHQGRAAQDGQAGEDARAGKEEIQSKITYFLVTFG